MIRPREGEAYVFSRVIHAGHGGGRDKLHKGGRYKPNNCIEMQLVLYELENIVRI